MGCLTSHFIYNIKKMSFIKKSFELRGSFSKKTTTKISIICLIVMLILWEMIAKTNGSVSQLLPAPSEVVLAIPQLFIEKNIATDICLSIQRNFMGYFKAIIYALPIGFLIGLFPICRALFYKYIDAIRFLPLAATTGIFILWYGIGEEVKVNFLAFSIFVYLLPIVIQRIDEIDTVYLQTAKTMGATKWQIIRTIFIPAVFSKLFDDIRVMVAISWTYIVIAELINATGGLGHKIQILARQSNTEGVFAVLIIIILLGVIQDFVFKMLDKIFFKHKHVLK
jgi:NitT/TauT family transport system permease protein